MSRRNIVPQPNASVIDGFYDPSNGDLRIQLDMPLTREGTTNCAFVMDASASMAAHYRRSRLGTDLAMWRALFTMQVLLSPITIAIMVFKFTYVV